MGNVSGLRAAGLLNADTEDLGTIAMGKRLAPAPFCYSPQCTYKSGKSNVRKFPRGYPDNCEDCGWTLHWRKIRMEHNSSNYIQEV